MVGWSLFRSKLAFSIVKKPPISCHPPPPFGWGSNPCTLHLGDGHGWVLGTHQHVSLLSIKTYWAKGGAFGKQKMVTKTSLLEMFSKHVTIYQIYIYIYMIPITCDIMHVDAWCTSKNETQK